MGGYVGGWWGLGRLSCGGAGRKCDGKGKKVGGGGVG